MVFAQPEDVAPQSDYRIALQLCSEVADEEYRHAHASVERMKIRLWSLRRETDAIVARSAVHPDTGTSDSQARVAEFAQRLNTETSGAIDATAAALTHKRLRLSRFTITLLGRTMAGKSTIREAVTEGNGETIGKGAQRTTRDVREYEWNALRIIDTPGLGAYEGSADRSLALSTVDKSDVLLFMVSSDGIQESSFRGMEYLRSHNKPIVFVLNVKLDLTRRVYMNRFLRSPESYLGDVAIQGHVARLHTLARDELGMSRVTVVPVHAQAAFLATRPEHSARAGEIHRASGIDRLIETLTSEVTSRGPVGRIRTILDGTIIKLMDLENLLREQAKHANRLANAHIAKFSELDSWLDSYLDNVNGRFKSVAKDLTRSLRQSVSSFVDDNLEREDFGERWEYLVADARIEHGLKKTMQHILDELRTRLEAFNRELRFDIEIGISFETQRPDQYSPLDINRTLRLVPAIGTALRSLTTLVSTFGAWNFWNVAGMAALALGLVAGGLSFLIPSREDKLKRRRKCVVKQLWKQIDEMERHIEQVSREWWYKEITIAHVRPIRDEMRRFYRGMSGLGKSITVSADACSREVAKLNRRLLWRCGALVGEPVEDEALDVIVRDPGMRTKLTWIDGRTGDEFCRKVGLVIDESIDGIGRAPKREMIARALAPARVRVEKIYFNSSWDRAIAPMPATETKRAIGKRGHNVRLATKLLEIPIHVVDEDRWHTAASN